MTILSVLVYIFVTVDNTIFSYHVPDVKFLTCEPIYVGKTSELIVSLCNPSQHVTSVRLLPVNFDKDNEVKVSLNNLHDIFYM